MEKIQPEFLGKGLPLFDSAEESRIAKIHEELKGEADEHAAEARGDMVQRSPNHGRAEARQLEEAKREQEITDRLHREEGWRYNSM